LSEQLGLFPAQLSLSFVLSFPQISTVIPGIKTPQQAIANTSGMKKLNDNHKNLLINLYEGKFDKLVEFIEEQET